MVGTVGVITGKVMVSLELSESLFKPCVHYIVKSLL